MITGYIGKTGSGKTHNAVKEIFKLWKKGYKIYTNIPLFFSDTNERIFEYEDLSELFNVKDGIILMDEAQVLLDAYEWQNLDKTFKYKLTQHRKDRLDLICTFQYIGAVNINLRRLFHKIILCKKMLRFPFDDKKLAIFQLYIKDKIILLETDGEAKNIKKKGIPSIGLISKWGEVLYDTNSQIGMYKYNMTITIDNKNINVEY